MYDIIVQSVNILNDRMLSFVTTRPKSFRFNSGEFAMIGQDKTFRAYSLVSSCYDDYLEFLSVRQVGEFTNKLEKIQSGDVLKIKPKATGSLCPMYLIPKTNLILLATGTGIAPFISIIKDFETYQRFNSVYLFHTVRYASELVYTNEILQMQKDFNLHFVGSVTRESHKNNGRFWEYIIPTIGSDFTKDRDSILVCGSPELNKMSRTKFSSMGFLEGNTGTLGDFLLERAFVD